MSDVESDEEGSLFGGDSPPPTRASSPTLALPTGTPAVPTPQEYPKPVQYHAYMHNALAGGPQAYYYAPIPYPMTPVPTRAPLAPVDAPKPKPPAVSPPPKKKPKKEKRTGPRVPPPIIRLPDPDGPPPVNFLRNQKALLGHAGLVGRVKPSKLSIERHRKGTTSSNPINVDDEDDAPAISFRALPISAVYAEVPKASTPTNEEIVASLIRQKNIFPILQSLLQLLAKSETPAGEEPPAKRRKTDGSEKKSYHSNWEQQRGRQLIAQLVGLIKTAANRAATKAYYDSQTARRDDTSRPSTPAVETPSPSFDTLVASLLAAAPESVPSNVTTPTTATPVPVDTTAPSTPEADVDQSMVNSWMSILQTYPSACAAPDDSYLGSTSSTPTIVGSPGPDGLDPNVKGKSTLLTIFLPIVDGNKTPLRSRADNDPIAAAAARLLAQTQIKQPKPRQQQQQQQQTHVYPRYVPYPGGPYMTTGAYLAATGMTAYIPIPPGKTYTPPPQPYQQQPPPTPYFPFTIPGQTASYATLMYARPPYYMPYQHMAPPSPYTTAAAPAVPLPAAHLEPQETVRKAKERRRQLLVEIERAKVEMWETTIEQGALVQLSRDTKVLEKEKETTSLSVG